MNMDTHNRYFRDIDYNTDTAVRWPAGSAAYVDGTLSVYQEQLAAKMRACTHAKDAEDMYDLLARSDPSVVCVWIRANPDSSNNMDFQNIARTFHLWHEYRRGSHGGIHEFYYENHFVLLLNVFDVSKYSRAMNPPLVSYKPKGASVLQAHHFDVRQLEQRRAKTLVGSQVQCVAARAPGLSCEEVCAASGKPSQCVPAMFSSCNSCEAMGNAFDGCAGGCEGSIGDEQPAFVKPEARPPHTPRKCLYSLAVEQSSCAASHPETYRLCPCSQ